VKKLQMPESWTWAAKDGSTQSVRNHEVLQACVREDFKYVIKQCEECGSTTLLVGRQEIRASICDSCGDGAKRTESTQTQMKEAWAEVRPSTNAYPKRVEEDRANEDLPPLSVAERSAIAVTLPFVTVTKNHLNNKRLKQESITVKSEQFQLTAAKVLPRTNLQSR
jgi:ribosomal protein L37E